MYPSVIKEVIEAQKSLRHFRMKQLEDKILNNIKEK